jgi:hypothetical protein
MGLKTYLQILYVVSFILETTKKVNMKLKLYVYIGSHVQRWTNIPEEYRLLRCDLALVRTDVLEERIASIIRVTVIGELSFGCSLLPTLFLARRFLLPGRWRLCVPPKRRFLQEPPGVTSQKTAFFIVTAVKASNLILSIVLLYIKKRTTDNVQSGDSCTNVPPSQVSR